MTLNLWQPILAAANPLDHVVDHVWGNLWLPGNSFFPGPGTGRFDIMTDRVFIMLVAGVLVLWTMKYAAQKAVALRGKAPTGTYNLIETVLQFIRLEVVQPVLGKNTDKFIPFVWTCFFFILYCNLLGMIPIKEITGLILFLGGLLFTGHANPEWLHKGVGGTPTGSIWVTGGLAFCSFVLFVGAGIKENGLWGFAKHLTAGAPWYMAPIMVPVEFAGLFVKPVALAIRLFANMTAGHILLAVILGFPTAALTTMSWEGTTAITIVSVIGALAINFLELFVALLQAYIFVFLTTLFVGLMIEHGDAEHEEEGAPEHPESGPRHHQRVAEGPGAHAVGATAAVLASHPELPAVYPMQTDGLKKDEKKEQLEKPKK